MRYLGGKSRLKKHLAPIVNAERKGGVVWDAFCGGLAMAEGLSDGGPVIATDACVPLIALYQAVAAGWEPPVVVTREVWDAAKQLPDEDPMKGFCGFGCSFSGMYFNGYIPPEIGGVRRSGPNAGKPWCNRMHETVINVLRRQLPKIDAIGCVDFLAVEPSDDFDAIYCDPPYRNTEGYAGVPPFDHDRFYTLCEEWAEYCPVFVSEYDCPIGRVVLEISDWYKGTKMAKNGTVERLYKIG